MADPEKDTYVGFFRDVSKSLDKAKYIIKSRKEIETQLINNCKNELLKYYPNTIFHLNELLILKKSPPYARSILNFNKQFRLDKSRYLNVKKSCNIKLR